MIQKYHVQNDVARNHWKNMDKYNGKLNNLKFPKWIWFGAPNYAFI
jgi:hypothetical protein